MPAFQPRDVPVYSEYQPAGRIATLFAPGPLVQKVVYILPVEARGSHIFGNPQQAIASLDLARWPEFAFVVPDFAQPPWYANHPTACELQQESHIVRAVCPQVEALLGSVDTKRYLLGFSKSGWGAWTLLLRHPDLFHRCMAWDAPLMMDKIGQWETREVFGTQSNFSEYSVTSLISANRLALKGQATRLGLRGHSLFSDDLRRMAALLSAEQIPFHYDYGSLRAHDWHSGWLQDAMAALIAL